MYDNEVIKEESWFKRNWKWVVPTGGCLTLIVVIAIFIVSAIYKLSSEIDNSDHAQYALEQIHQNEKAIEILGQPIEKGDVSNINLQWINGVSKISFDMTVSGPKNKGTVYLKAEKKGDDYSYKEMRLKIDETNEVINLVSY